MSNDIKIPFVDLYPQYEELQTEIDMAIKDIILRSDFITGPTVDNFERAICDYTGAEDCASIGSGTNALTCALRALGIGPGHQVMTVGHTFVSTTEPVTYDLLTKYIFVPSCSKNRPFCAPKYPILCLRFSLAGSITNVLRICKDFPG